MSTPRRTPAGHPRRSVDRALARDAAAIAAAMVAVGGSFGAITIAYGLPAWLPFAMSTLVFAGGAQFLAAGLLAAGNPVAAVLAGLLLNARHLPFGMAVATTIGPRLRDRLVAAHLMTDETVAFTLRETDPARRRSTYWLIGTTLFLSWNTGTALGVLIGTTAGDPTALGLDAAFPAGLIALILPALRDGTTRAAALTGAAVAVLLTPLLPAGLPVLCALLGLLVLFVPALRKPSITPSAPASAPAASAEVEAPGPNSAADSADPAPLATNSDTAQIGLPSPDSSQPGNGPLDVSAADVSPSDGSLLAGVAFDGWQARGGARSTSQSSGSQVGGAQRGGAGSGSQSGGSRSAQPGDVEPDGLRSSDSRGGNPGPEAEPGGAGPGEGGGEFEGAGSGGAASDQAGLDGARSDEGGRSR